MRYAGGIIDITDIETGVWATYVPTLTGTTLGNGTLEARYSRMGNTVSAEISLLVGSTTVLAANVIFGLPIAASVLPSSLLWLFPRGVAVASLGANRYVGHAVLATATQVGVLQNGGTNNASRWGSGGPTPNTFATGHSILIHVQYEAA